jgi:YjjI family glycine radical enzyme
MRLEELQDQVRACIADPTLTYRQRVQRLALLAENSLEPPAVSEACRQAQHDGIIHDMGEGNAPYRPRYILPDYAVLLANGSAHLELPAPTTLAQAADTLLIAYTNVPSITGYPVWLGDLDVLLEPFAAEVDDEELDAQMRRFWVAIDRMLPDAFVHANLGPNDLRVTRAILGVDAALKQVVPNLTLRVDPQLTPDSLLAQAVLTTCADGKPHLVNDPLMTGDLGPRYGVVSCYNSLPAGGGSYTLNRLNLRAGVQAHRGGTEEFLDATLPRLVALNAELIASRIRFLVEQARWFEHDWLVREGLVTRERFSAMYGIYGVAEAAELLLARVGSGARYGVDTEADELVHRLIVRISDLVNAIELPYCEVSGGHALLHAQSGIDTDLDTTAGARVPVGREPGLYRHIHAVAPNHRWFPAGISDVFRFDPTVAKNPQAVVAVVRGAFASGMRDFTFEVAGNGFTRVTGYLVRSADVAQVSAGARHSSTFLGATAIVNQRLDERVVKHS